MYSSRGSHSDLLAVVVVEEISDEDPKLPASVMAALPEGEVFRTGQLIASRFRILRFIARGAIGQIYEAFDEKLGFCMAIKTLHPSVLAEFGSLERFKREIRIALQVSHENLCRVYDLHEHIEPGTLPITCLSMELLDAGTLQDYAARKRPLSPPCALPLIRQIASALQALHDHGIIHRDLKPSNILMTRLPNGSLRAVVTDFGLAKSIYGDMGLFETQAEIRAGSPLFMAPELWAGSQPSTASDVYAFAMIIDELVTRSPAFNASSVASLCYCKLNESPISPSLRSEQLPTRWEHVILRCLEKDPELRYKAVSDVIADLSGSELDLTVKLPLPFIHNEQTESAQAECENPSVAVMPFEDLSPAKDQRYFCDGLTEEIIHLLSQVKDLRVIAHTSVFAMRNADRDIRNIGRILGVTHILEGSFRRIGDDIRLMTRLVDAGRGSMVYSQRYDRKLTDVFSIQDEVASTLVASLKLEVINRGRQLPVNTLDMGFYSWYLRGVHEFNQQTPEAVRRAIKSFEESIAINIDFAPAHAALADAYTTLAWYGALPPSKAMLEAENSVLTALRMDGNSAAAHCAFAIVKARFRWDWPGAEKEFQTALDLNSGLARTHFSYALDYLTSLGKLDEALSELLWAQSIDPLSLIVQTALGGTYFRKREYERATELLTKVIEMDANFYHGHWSLARCLEQLGMYQEAVHAYRTALRLAENSTTIMAELGHCFGQMHDTRSTRDIYTQLLEITRQQYVSPLCFALVHLGAGEREKALEILQHALEDRSGMLVWLGVDPRWDVLRSNRVFQAALSRIGLQGSNAATN